MSVETRPLRPSLVGTDCVVSGRSGGGHVAGGKGARKGTRQAGLSGEFYLPVGQVTRRQLLDRGRQGVGQVSVGRKSISCPDSLAVLSMVGSVIRRGLVRFGRVAWRGRTINDNWIRYTS